MFWQKFIELCNLKGEAPNVVASKVGVKSSGTVTGWKSGATPRASVLVKLADYFGVTVSELTDGQKETPSTSESEERIPGYEDLSEDDKAKVRSYVEFLLTSQHKD